MLSGVNKKCENCQKECKQWKQVKIIACPSYLRMTPKMNEKTLVGEKKSKIDL